MGSLKGVVDIIDDDKGAKRHGPKSTKIRIFEKFTSRKNN